MKRFSLFVALLLLLPALSRAAGYSEAVNADKPSLYLPFDDNKDPSAAPALGHSLKIEQGESFPIENAISVGDFSAEWWQYVSDTNGTIPLLACFDSAGHSIAAISVRTPPDQQGKKNAVAQFSAGEAPAAYFKAN